MSKIAQIEQLLREGIAFQQNSESQSALRKYDEVLALAPGQIDALYFKSLILMAQSDWEKAGELLQQAVATDNPHVPLSTRRRCHTALGSVYQQKDKLEEAEMHFRKALTFDAPTADRWIDLAQCLIDAGKMSEAAESVAQANRMDSNHIRVLSANAEIAWRSWQVEDCLRYLQEAVQVEPTNLDLVSQYLFTLNYLDDTGEHNAAAEHTMIGKVLQEYYRANISDTPVPHQDHTTLHIGFLSPDLKLHSVAYFLIALLEGLKTQDNVNTYCYSTGRKTDKMTERIRSVCDHFREVNPRNLTETVASDSLDILFDLAGHSAGNSLPTLLSAPKLAPVYINWLGYANTTGFPLFDYRLVDRMTDPVADQADPVAEQLLYLDPTFLCYAPPADAPDINRLPALESPFLTFGCMNNLNKVTPTMLDTWVELLLLDARYRLLFKSPMLRQISVCERLKAPFLAAGIDPERLILLDRTEDTRSHLAVYHRIDLSLDTFPYNGTTTTLESLYMGCPVVTLCGSSHRSRVSASLLDTLGCPQWIAQTKAEYLDLIRASTQNLAGLQETRISLRNELLASKLCDSEAFASEFMARCRLVTNR